MAVDVFLDTNVLLQFMFIKAPLHSQAEALVDKYVTSRAQIWISRQILREYLAQVTRPQPYLAAPLDMNEIEKHLDSIQHDFAVAEETGAITKQLLLLMRQFPTGGKQVHDANIVATMLVNGIGTLLTRNIVDMRRFSPLISVITLE